MRARVLIRIHGRVLVKELATSACLIACLQHARQVGFFQQLVEHLWVKIKEHPLQPAPEGQTMRL